MKTINMEYKYIQYKDNNTQEVKDFLNQLKEDYLIAVQENQDNEIKGIQISFTKMQNTKSRGSIFVPVNGYLVLDVENHLISYREENFKKKFNTKDKKYDFSRKKENEIYFAILSDNEINGMEEVFDHTDSGNYDVANYFPSEEIAEKFAKIQTLQRKLLRFSLENGMDEIDWNDCNSEKYYIYYGFYTNNCYIDACYSCKDVNEVYFKDEEIAEKALELFKDDLKEVANIKW